MTFAWAYARAETQALAPLEYSGFLWAALFGWLFFREPVTWPTLTGAGLIVLGVLAGRAAQAAGAECGLGLRRGGGLGRLVVAGKLVPHNAQRAAGECRQRQRQRHRNDVDRFARASGGTDRH